MTNASAKLVERLNRAADILDKHPSEVYALNGTCREAAASIVELEAEIERLRNEMESLADLWPGAPTTIGTTKEWDAGFVAGLKAFRASVHRTIDELDHARLAPAASDPEVLS